MDSETYADPKVIALVRQKYLAVKVDQDSRPDISNRYEEYGWLATVVFNPNGSEIVMPLAAPAGFRESTGIFTPGRMVGRSMPLRLWRR